ncbi:Vacuolar protein sorting-associated protein 70 [Coemansia sp. RSA 2424]|nr:Vacuolar protein sorting-associated protein 70 [Coemansia sp. RSA 2424]
MKLGWRPRRTIILASWDAEEYGMVGSTEWVEDNIDWIRADVVAYVNVDAAVMGSEFDASASPILKDLLFEATKRVDFPGSNATVYDAWLRQSRRELTSDRGSHRKHLTPPVRSLGSGSDYTPFMAHAGVSSLSLGFGGGLGAYHSNYDSFKRMATFLDSDFELHRAMVRICGLVVIHLADDAILKLSPVSYARALAGYIRQLEEQVAGYTAGLNGAAKKRLHRLRAAQRQLLTNAHLVEQSKHRLRSVYGEDCQMAGRRRRMNCRKLRKSINDRASRLERHFIDPDGLPGREWYRHALFGPGRWMGYDAQVFPALAEAAEDRKWRLFRQYEKRTAEIIYEAAWFLREV